MKLTNQALALIGVVVLSVSIIAGTLIISNGNFYIKNLGSSVEQGGQIVNTISVSGDGKVYAKPDMVNISFSFSELEDTSSAALQKVNEKINAIKDILKIKGIEDKDIQTSALNIYPEYDYSGSQTILKGQRATSSLNVTVRKIDDKATKATDIIDEVSKVNNIQISNIGFDIEDKTAMFSQSRELAFNKAKQKAEELAKLSGVKLLKPVSITDTTYDIVPPQPYSNYAVLDKAAGSASSTSISTGQLEVSISLSVIWGID